VFDVVHYIALGFISRQVFAKMIRALNVL